MPAGWVSVVSDRITDSNQSPTKALLKVRCIVTQGFLILNESWRIARNKLTSKSDPIQIGQSSSTCDLVPVPNIYFMADWIAAHASSRPRPVAAE